MSRKKIFLLLTGLILFALVIAACNNSKANDEKSPEAVYTEAAETVAAQLTNMAEDSEEEIERTSTPEVMDNPESTSTPESESSTPTEPSEEEEEPTPAEQQPTQSGNCTLRAEFIKDITYPDDTILTPGETFTKTWQIMNSGSCTWGEGYTVFYITGDNLSAPESSTLTHGVDVPEGTLINVSVNLVAPSEEGEYRADFKFKDASGNIFGTGSGSGGTVYVKIIVAEPTPEPTNTTQPTETPVSTETPTLEPTPTETSSSS